MNRILVPILLAFALAFAGCLTTPADPGDVESDPVAPTPEDDGDGDGAESAPADDPVDEQPTDDAADDSSGNETTSTGNETLSLPETWYLFWPTEGDECGDRYMSRAFSEDGMSCYYVDSPLSPAFEAIDLTFWYDFEADATSQGFAAGTPVAGTVYVQLTGLVEGEVVIELLADGKPVANLTMDLGPAPGTGEMENITFQMETTQAIAAGAELDFRIAVNTLALVQFATSAELPSAFTIGAEPTTQ